MKGSFFGKFKCFLSALAGCVVGYGISYLVPTGELWKNVTKDNTLLERSENSVFFDMEQLVDKVGERVENYIAWLSESTEKGQSNFKTEITPRVDFVNQKEYSSIENLSEMEENDFVEKEEDRETIHQNSSQIQQEEANVIEAKENKLVIDLSQMNFGARKEFEVAINGEFEENTELNDMESMGNQLWIENEESEKEPMGNQKEKIAKEQEKNPEENQSIEPKESNKTETKENQFTEIGANVEIEKVKEENKSKENEIEKEIIQDRIDGEENQQIEESNQREKETEVNLQEIAKLKENLQENTGENRETQAEQATIYPMEIFGQIPIVNRSDEYVTYFEFAQDLVELLEPKVIQQERNGATLFAQFVLKALFCGVKIQKLDINAPITRKDAALALWITAEIMGEQGNHTLASSAETYATDVKNCSNSEKKAIVYLYEQEILSGYSLENQIFEPEEYLTTKAGEHWLMRIEECWN